MPENMWEICKNNTGSNLNTKVSTWSRTISMNKNQNLDRGIFFKNNKTPKQNYPWLFKNGQK